MGNNQAKNLKFERNLVEKILDGTKTTTWRMFDDKNLKTGDYVYFFDKDSGNKFAEAKIVGVREKFFSEINEKDFDGHEKFTSRNDMLKTYQRYYKEKIDWNTIVKIINFKILTTDRIKIN